MCGSMSFVVFGETTIPRRLSDGSSEVGECSRPAGRRQSIQGRVRPLFWFTGESRLCSLFHHCLSTACVWLLDVARARQTIACSMASRYSLSYDRTPSIEYCRCFVVTIVRIIVQIRSPQSNYVHVCQSFESTGTLAKEILSTCTKT